MCKYNVFNQKNLAGEKTQISVQRHLHLGYSDLILYLMRGKKQLIYILYFFSKVWFITRLKISIQISV